MFLNGKFTVEGGALLTNNWSIMSLIDLFAGLIIFYTWVIFREKNILTIIIMLPLTVFFGFLTASVYLGFPATLTVLIATVIYRVWRLQNLGGPGVDEFEEGKEAPWIGQKKGF